MKTIIVYYSHTHNNEILAGDIQKKLSCDILKIEEVKKRTGFTILLDLLFDRTPTLKGHAASLNLYDDFIFVGPIWASKIASPLKAFLLKEKKYIKHYSFISLCGGVKGQLEKINKQLLLILQHEPEAIKELCINDLPVSERKNAAKYLESFKDRIDEFLSTRFVKANV